MTDLGERTLTADQAALLVRPGDRVFVGTACATPRALVRALEELPDPPAGVTLVHSLTDRIGLSPDGRGALTRPPSSTTCASQRMRRDNGHRLQL